MRDSVDVMDLYRKRLAETEAETTADQIVADMYGVFGHAALAKLCGECVKPDGRLNFTPLDTIRLQLATLARQATSEAVAQVDPASEARMRNLVPIHSSGRTSNTSPESVAPRPMAIPGVVIDSQEAEFTGDNRPWSSRLGRQV